MSSLPSVPSWCKYPDHRVRVGGVDSCETSCPDICTDGRCFARPMPSPGVVGELFRATNGLLSAFLKEISKLRSILRGKMGG